MKIEKAARLAARNRYTKPKLEILGSVVDLTASGSQQSPEGSGVGNANRRP